MTKPLGFTLLVALITVSVGTFLSGAQDGRQRRGGSSRSRAVPVPLPSALPLTAHTPGDNPSDPDRIALGRLLFWDPILSGGKDVACATCHHPDFGYAENLDISIGVHGCRAWRESALRLTGTDPLRQAQQPDDLERRVQRHRSGRSTTIQPTRRCSGMSA